MVSLPTTGPAFLKLRRGDTPASLAILERLQLPDRKDGIGSSVVKALAATIYIEATN